MLAIGFDTFHISCLRSDCGWCVFHVGAQGPVLCCGYQAAVSSGSRSIVCDLTGHSAFTKGLDSGAQSLQETDSPGLGPRRGKREKERKTVSGR